ncbi:MAG: exodeoxyribonuclease III [Gammaproteobacteria bacterium]
MRIISLNCNGIRSAHAKGLYTWLSRQRADVVCLQETKAQIDQLKPEIRNPKAWNAFFVDAQKKGYSGVAIFSKREPDRVIRGLNHELFDSEGRYVQVDFGNLSIASLYLPSGSSSEERQAIKFKFLDYYLPELKRMRNDGRDYILCGDWNIAHKKIDLKNWRSNQKNSGFLPQEREWMDLLFNDAGYVDAFRIVDQSPDQYTWWSNRGQAWANNVGWRIDYQVISQSLADKVQAAKIYKQKRFSDHAPLIMDYALDY